MPTAESPARRHLNQPERRQAGGGIIAAADSVSVVDVTTDTATSLIVYRPSETASLPLTSIPSPLNAPPAQASDAEVSPSPALLSSDPAIPPAATASASGDTAEASQSSPGSNRVVAAGGSDTSPSSNQSSGAGRARASVMPSITGGALGMMAAGLLSFAVI